MQTYSHLCNVPMQAKRKRTGGRLSGIPMSDFIAHAVVREKELLYVG
jgi:hypothetical protein